MKFANVYMFHFMWGLLLFGVLLFFYWEKRKKRTKKFAPEHLLNELSSPKSIKRVVLKAILLIAGLFFCVLALARPQWGYQWREIKRQGLDIIVAVDVSKSMLAEDIKPNRLGRVKLALRDLVKKLEGDRIGLIGFSGQAFVFCPLTIDYSGFLLSLDELDINSIPRGGTNVGQAISEAIKGYENTPSKHKAVILITDGDNLEGKPVEWAKKASDKGIKIFTVGVGTIDGELIRIRNENNELEFLKDANGNFVKSRLNEQLLQEIALQTKGAYIRASGAYFGLDALFDHHLAGLEKRDIQSKVEKKYFDRYQIPIAIALFFLTVEVIIHTRRENE